MCVCRLVAYACMHVCVCVRAHTHMDTRVCVCVCVCVFSWMDSCLFLPPYH